MGDFNQVLQSLKLILFLQQVFRCRVQKTFENVSLLVLFDISSRGCFFTWTNKCPLNPKSRKLDRTLINEAWQDTFLDSNAFFDVPGSSYHSPCLVTLSNYVVRRSSHFNFFTFFTLHPVYNRLMQLAWTSVLIPSGPMFTLYQKLRAAKSYYKAINYGSFSNIQKRTKLAFELLESIQRHVLSNLSQTLFEQKKTARNSWLSLALAEEAFFRQKSRIYWLKECVANTGFFYKLVIANMSNNIIYLLKNDGNRGSNSSMLKNMVIQYYSDLLGVQNSAV